MSARLSCPSCNTAFSLDAIPEHRRVTCPRCGDIFPIRGEGGAENTGPKTIDGGQPSAVAQYQNQKHKAEHSRRTPMVVVGLVVVTVAIGLTIYFTRTPKPRTEPQLAPEITATATPPVQLTGLGYLPAECNVVFAIQPGPLHVHAERMKQEPRQTLAQVGLPEQVLGTLDSIGIPLAQIDHIAGGTHIGDTVFEPRLALAVVLKQPHADETGFLKNLKAKATPGGKERYEVELGKLPLTLARVSPTVWVFGWSDNDLRAVEKGGFGPGGTQFRKSESHDGRGLYGSVQGMIRAVPSEAAVWAVAHDERDWTQKPLIQFVGKSPDAKKWLPVFKDGRGGMAAITFGERPRMTLLVRTAEPATAERVRGYFQARATEIESAESLFCGETCAQFDGPFDPKTLQRFLADAAK